VGIRTRYKSGVLPIMLQLLARLRVMAVYLGMSTERSAYTSEVAGIYRAGTEYLVTRTATKNNAFTLYAAAAFKTGRVCLGTLAYVPKEAVIPVR
jgi:hypothetical protein